MEEIKQEIELSKLNQDYNDAISCDKKWVAEMRSNALLVSGDHYYKATSGVADRIRQRSDISNDTKIRLTKNHIGVIAKIYANNIQSYAPGITVVPKNATEIQDKKVAEMFASVWEDAKERHNFDALITELCDDFFLGEIAVKIYFDPNAGAFKGYEQLLNPDGTPAFEMIEQIDPITGMPIQVQGEMIPDMTKPIFMGDILVEKIFAGNLFRAPEAKSLQTSRFLGLHKMVSTKDLKKSFPKAAEKLIESEDKTFVVFDSGTEGGYRNTDKTESLVKEIYYRPCADYPKGWYAIFTEEVSLDQGELPDGIFPIVTECFDAIPTTPRGKSLIKQLRPYQVEHNRCESKMAEHQMTLGDDRIITSSQSKMSSGATVNGIRQTSVTNAQLAPTVIPGRSGAQYLEYAMANLDEMYKVAMVAEDMTPKQGFDQYTMLYAAASQKKAYQRYVKRFENFLKVFAKTYFRFAKTYLDDETVISLIGKSEQVNIKEFKSASDLALQIKVEPRADDMTTQMGKQMVMNHILQYTGQKIERDDIGRIIKNMPFSNADDLTSDLTLNYTIAENTILALDRGEIPKPEKIAGQEYLVTKLQARTLAPDFQFLSPMIQENYRQVIAMHQQIIAENNLAIQQANQGLIPTTGAMVGVDLYVPKVDDPTKSQRLRLPSDMIAYMVDLAEKQGMGMAEQKKMFSPEQQAEIARVQMEKSQGAPMQVNQPMPL